MPKSAKSQKGWVYVPRRPAPPTVPVALKREVEEKANALVEAVLKPRYVSPPENPQFNYIEELGTKWYRSSFYFCAQYRSAGPYALGGQFETRFARMKYTGAGLFALAFMRYTGEWVEVYAGLTLDACLASIRDDGWFHP
ncbi:MAG: hypothetical protein WDZ49_16660 [Litorilinea sp.]